MQREECSFHENAGGNCGFSPKDRTKSTALIHLVDCKRSIESHASSFSFTGVKDEVDLILSRAFLFTNPRNIDTLNICPSHRESLGLSWKRSSTKCCIPIVLSSHSVKAKERPKAERGLSKDGSQIVFGETGICIPVGAGELCSSTR